MTRYLLLFLFFSISANGAEFREFTGKAQILNSPKKLPVKENSKPQVKAKILITELIDSVPRDYKYDYLTGKIESRKKYDVVLHLEKSISLKKGDEIYFACDWTCSPKSEVCSEKNWHEIDEAKATARLKAN